MGWVKRSKRPHSCPLPAPHGYAAVGDLWRCRKCKQVWELYHIDGYFERWNWRTIDG